MQAFSEITTGCIHWTDDKAVREAFERVEKATHEAVAAVAPSALIEFKSVEPDEPLLAGWDKSTRGDRLRITWYSARYFDLLSRLLDKPDSWRRPVDPAALPDLPSLPLHPDAPIRQG